MFVLTVIAKIVICYFNKLGNDISKNVANIFDIQL